MASTINAQTTPFAAVVTSADSTGNLALQTANVTALTISSSQVVSLTNPLPVTSGGTGNTTGAVANSVTFNSSGAGAASGTTYNGSTAQTISYNTLGAQVAGTYVTSVTGTAPVVSSGGTTPAISMAAATTSVSGYLTSTDWNTFNGKYSTGGALGTPSSGTLTNCTGYTYANLSGTVPTWNQNTTGSAATATTATNASNLTGGNITGNMIVGNATSPNSYYVQFGDNTGWVYRFMTNVSGTPTVRFSFQDNGAFTAVNNITAYSDERLKKNWRPVQEGFIEKLAQVKSGIYDRTDIEATQAGVSAQDMQKLLAEAVQKDEAGILSLAYGNAALVAAIELAKQVVELKKEIELLKAK